jgi:hypothetical protein
MFPDPQTRQAHREDDFQKWGTSTWEAQHVNRSFHSAPPSKKELCPEIDTWALQGPKHGRPRSRGSVSSVLKISQYCIDDVEL